MANSPIPEDLGRIPRLYFQGIVGCTPTNVRTPMGNPPKKKTPYIIVCMAMGYNPQESLQNTINTIQLSLDIWLKCMGSVGKIYQTWILWGKLTH